MHRSSSAFNTSSCRVFRQSSAKTQGIASELLRRSALGLENGVSSGSRIGAAWHYENEKGFSLQRDLLPATTGKVVLRNFDRPKNIVFPPLKRFIISRRRSNGEQRTRKMPTLRGLLLLLAVEDRSERCGANATAKPKRQVRSFEDIHFPHSG
jgi:hypothetical protein